MLIQVTNHSTGVSNADLILWCSAIADQLCNEFAVAHDLAPTQVELNTSGVEDPKALQMGIFDTSDQPGALGYHDTDAQGRPRGFVFAKTTMDDGEIVSVTLSHECMEMRLNRYCALWSMTPDGNFRAFEAGDAVENDSYEKPVGDTMVKVSNFVTAAYFSPIKTGEPTDHMGTLNGEPAPTRSKGGYDIEQNSAGQPTQEFSRKWQELSDAKARRKSHPLSRTAKLAGKTLQRRP